MEKKKNLWESTDKCRCMLQSEKLDSVRLNLTRHFIFWSNTWFIEIMISVLRFFKAWHCNEYGIPSFTSSGKLDPEDEHLTLELHNGKHCGQYPAEKHEEISETSEAQKLCYITSRCYGMPGYLL